MKIHVIERKADKKSNVKNLRRSGQIPAVIYHRSKEAETVSLDSAEFSAHLRNVMPGRLSTTVFTLSGKNGTTRKAILKDIQYNPINYNVIHLDFEELIENLPVNVKVPIECTGIADCAGIKLGGFLRQVIRFVRVSCLPKDIPTNFEINVKDMSMYESKRVKDLVIPNTARPLAKMNEVVVVIAKR